MTLVPRQSGHRALIIFSLAAWGFLMSMFYRVSVTVLNEELARDLSLDPREMAIISSAFFYAFGLAQLPLSLALDRLGTRKVLTGLGLIASLGSLVFGLAQGSSSALLGRALLGLGMAGNLMGAMTLIAAWFPADRFATLSGLLVSIGSTGLLLASSPLALLAQELTWRGTFFLAAAINLIQVVIFYLLVQDRPPGVPAFHHTASPLSDLMRLFKAPYYWLISFGAFARFGAHMAIHSLWAGPFLMQALGYSQVATGNVLLGLSLGYIVGQPVAGRLSDSMRIGRKPFILASLSGQGLLTACLIFWPVSINPIWAILLFFLMGFISAPGHTMYAHIKELLPREMTGMAMTGINFFNMLGPAILIQLSGFLAPSSQDAAGNPGAYLPVWLCLAIPLFLAASGYILTPESYRRNPPSGGRQ